MSANKNAAQIGEIRRTLRKVGLPDTLFDDDFQQQYQHAVETRKRLILLARQVANDAQWRENEVVQQLAAMDPDQPWPLTIVAGSWPLWRRPLMDWLRLYRHGFLDLNQELRRAKSHKRPPGRFTRRRALLLAAGYDPDKLHQAQ